MSEATSIALHALAYVASQGTTVNATDLAKICGASEAHTMKVCQRLTKAGILSARRGPGGGFTLAREATSIQLREIYSLFDGPMQVGHCMFATPACGEQDMHNRIFGDRMARINQQIVQYFSETRLSDIAANCHRALVLPTPVDERVSEGGRSRSNKGT
jgi:Rrf2 family protein